MFNNYFTRLKERFAEDPDPTRTDVFDVMREVPASTKKVASFLGTFAKSVQEEIAKSGGSVGLTLTAPITGKREITSEELDPDMRKFKELVFGKDPVKAIETRIAEGELKVKEYAEKKEMPTLEKHALPVSALGVGAMIGMDFTGWGGGKKQVVKVLSKTKDISFISKTLKQLNVADDLVSSYAPKIANMSKTDDVAKAINRIDDIQKTTKSKPTTAVQQLAEEAKKAKPFEWKERQFLESVRNARPDIPLRVSGQYVPRSTDRLAMKARTLIRENIHTAENIARTRTDDTAVATASELLKHYSDEASKATNQATKDALYDKAGELAHLTARNLTEQGRAVQSASIIGRLTPEGILRFTAKQINKYNEIIEETRGGLGGLKKKIPVLGAKETGEILTEMKKIEAMPDGVKKAISFNTLNNRLADIVPSANYKKAINLWKAGLLTGIKTTGLNTLANLSHGFSEVIKDVPAVVVDSVASLFTGKRTIGLTTRGIPSGVKEGFSKGWRYMRTGFDERNIGAKLDYKRISFGSGKLAKAAQKYEETIFHLMGAEDQPFFYGAKARSIQSQSIAQAINKGLKGQPAKRFVEHLCANPTDEMIKYAVGDAEMAVFQNPTTLGRIAKAIQNVPYGEVVVPFGRTPAAVATQLFNYSPAGIVSAIVKNIGKGRFDQKLFSEAIGRGISGTAIMYIGTELYKKGLICLNYPKTERERKLWQVEGKKPNSIKIFGKYRNINVLGPAGPALVVGGYYQRAMEATGSHIHALTDAVFGGFKSLTEQTFLQGLSAIVNAVNDPERFASTYFESLAGSIVPTIIGDVAKAKDPLERKTTGFLGRLKAKIPYIREDLEPQIDILGRERQRAGTAVETMFDPTRPSMETGNAVSDELRRLMDAGHKVSPTQLGNRDGYSALTPEQNTALWKKAGELTNSKLNNLFQLEQYKNADDEDKAKVIADFTQRSNTIARAEAVADLTNGLKGQELKTKLSELKASGLMTKQVFDKFLELF